MGIITTFTKEFFQNIVFRFLHFLFVRYVSPVLRRKLKILMGVYSSKIQSHLLVIRCLWIKDGSYWHTVKRLIVEVICLTFLLLISTYGYSFVGIDTGNEVLIMPTPTVTPVIIITVTPVFNTPVAATPTQASEFNVFIPMK